MNIWEEIFIKSTSNLEPQDLSGEYTPTITTEAILNGFKTSCFLS